MHLLGPLPVAFATLTAQRDDGSPDTDAVMTGSDGSTRGVSYGDSECVSLASLIRLIPSQH